jgi:hypothetical protein
MQFRKWPVFILALFTVSSIMFCLGSDYPQPEPVMMLYGFVFIRTVTGQNVAAPQGLHVYARTDDKALSNSTTLMGSRYTLPISGIENGTSVNISVQDIGVTSVQYYDWNVTYLNLTVTDLTPPSIEPLSPQPGVTLFQVPIWINATITDNLMVNPSSIATSLNETSTVAAYDLANGLLSCKVVEAFSGVYSINVTAEDLAGNVASRTWDFTYLMPAPPTVSLIFPTTENPAYTQSGENITITYNYAETYPRNVTITVYNTTNTIGQLSILALEEGNKTRMDTLLIDETSSDAKYALSIVISNTFGLVQKIEQAEAVVVDDTPPTITQINQSPSPDNVQPTDPVNVNTTVKDALSGVRNATLQWRTENDEWNAELMNRIAPDVYSGTIPALKNQTQVYYKIEAFDQAGNQAVEDDAGRYYTYQVVPEYRLIPLILLLMPTSVAILQKKLLAKKKSPRSFSGTLT